MIVVTERGLFPVDSVEAEVAHMAYVATIVLNDHTNDQVPYAAVRFPATPPCWRSTASPCCSGDS